MGRQVQPKGGRAPRIMTPPPAPHPNPSDNLSQGETTMDVRKLGGLAAAALTVILTMGSACQRPDPCARLGPPTAADVAVANAGREVEVEVDNGSTECVVSGGRWVATTD